MERHLGRSIQEVTRRVVENSPRTGCFLGILALMGGMSYVGALEVRNIFFGQPTPVPTRQASVVPQRPLATRTPAEIEADVSLSTTLNRQKETKGDSIIGTWLFLPCPKEAASWRILNTDPSNGQGFVESDGNDWDPGMDNIVDGYRWFPVVPYVDAIKPNGSYIGQSYIECKKGDGYVIESQNFVYRITIED